MIRIEGKLFEQLFFGENAKYVESERQVLLRRGKARQSGQFIPSFSHCKRLVIKQHQEKVGWDPANPSTKLSKNFFEAVTEYLPVEERDKLRLYCAVGSLLDFYHHVDGFFKLGRGRPSFYFDVTTAQNKEPRGKLDLIVYRLENMDKWLEYFREIAPIVAQKIMGTKIS